ncbi:hypothetical protein AVEN_201539-1, partial [Araneus ventricosus]
METTGITEMKIMKCKGRLIGLF